MAENTPYKDGRTFCYKDLEDAALSWAQSVLDEEDKLDVELSEKRLNDPNPSSNSL